MTDQPATDFLKQQAANDKAVKNLDTDKAKNDAKCVQRAKALE
jgi:hypothetical protein